MPSGAFSSAQEHATASNKAPRSDRPAPFRNAMRRIFPRAIHRPPRRSKGNGHRTYAYSRAVQQPSAPQTSARCPVGSCGAAGNRRPWLSRRAADALPSAVRKEAHAELTHADSPVWKPTKHFSQHPFRCIPYRHLRAHFKASVSRPAKTASCRLKKTRRRARSVPRPRQCVLKGGSSAGPRAPLSPLHLPNVFDNAV